MGRSVQVVSELKIGAAVVEGCRTEPACQASTDRQSCSVLGVTRGTLDGSAKERCGVTGPISTGHDAWGRRHCGAANSRAVCKAQSAQEGSVKPQCPD